MRACTRCSSARKQQTPPEAAGAGRAASGRWRQVLVKPAMEKRSGGPVAQQARAIPLPGARMGSRRAMLNDAIEIDEQHALGIPQQIHRLEVAMADLLAMHGLEQADHRPRLGGGRFTVGRQVNQQIRPWAELADQPAPPPQWSHALLDQRQRLRRGNAEKLQAVPFPPGMPGPRHGPLSQVEEAWEQDVMRLAGKAQHQGAAWGLGPDDAVIKK